MGWLSDIGNGIASGAAAVGNEASKAWNYAKGALDPSTPANPAESTDAKRARALADYYQQQGQRAPGVEQTIAPQQLDQTQANQTRDIQNQNLADLQGVASGKTKTAADTLLTQGTDTAARNAMGLAAQYSRANPGEALRQGLAAQGAIGNQAASQAAIQKAQEQAQARGELGAAAAGVRGQDLGAAGANQQAENTAAAQNQAANLQEQGLNNQFVLGTGQLATQNTLAPLQAQIANQNAAVQTNAQKQKGFGAVLGGLGDVATSIFSDERVKKNVRKKSLADAYADEIHGVEFEYKPGEGDGKHHAGVIAQEVEKAIPGAVSHDDRGMKKVDPGHVSLASAGAIADIARRLRALEDHYTRGKAA